MAKKVQPSFSRGEISPQLHGRVDTSVYKTGLATARNMTVHTYGGVSARHGTKFIGECKFNDGVQRLIPFEFKTEDQYILEFGDLYMRVIRNDAYVLDANNDITAITIANPGVFTSTAHGLVNGDDVLLSGIGGMTELNNRRVLVANVTTNTFTIQDLITGDDIDTTGLTAFTSGGSANKNYEIATPYDEDDLAELTYLQTADKMTFSHKNYFPMELGRQDHDDWTLAPIDVNPDTDAPTNMQVVANSTGSVTVFYKVTAINGETGEESLAGLRTGSNKTITNITSGSTARVTTSANHNFETGDEVRITTVAGMTEVNDERFIIEDITATTFDIYYPEGGAVDSTNFTAYSSGGTVVGAFDNITNSQANYDNTITWDAVDDAIRYKLYRQENGLYQFIGETALTTFTDDNITANSTIRPPEFRNPFRLEDEYPGAVGFYQQRRVLGGSILAPDTSEFSRIGVFDNFTRRSPVTDDDAISATLAARQVNEIRHYVSLNDLLVFTSGSEWEISPGNSNGFSSGSITQNPQSYWGSGYLAPIVIGNAVLFVTRDGSNVRTFGFSDNLNGYTGEDLNVTSQHLVDGFEIVDWDNTQSPEKQVFMVRSDGQVVTLTYDKEQETIGWTRWDTDGQFKNVATLKEGGRKNEDSAYFIVERLVNGELVRYVEVWRQEFFDDVRDCYFVDCGLSLDVPLTITNVSGTSETTITSASHGLSNGDEVDFFDIQWVTVLDDLCNPVVDDGINKRRYTIENVTTDTFDLVDGPTSADRPTYLRGGTVRKAVDTVGGMFHLEGDTLVALCDGNVLRNLTVTDGIVEFPRKFSRIHLGRSYVSDVETLNIEEDENSTQQGSDHKVNKVLVRFFKSRGFFVGPNNTDLVEAKQRQFEALGDPTDLLTGDQQVYLPSHWNSTGRVFIRQKDPLPMTVLAVIPEYEVGDI